MHRSQKLWTLTGPMKITIIMDDATAHKPLTVRLYGCNVSGQTAANVLVVLHRPRRHHLDGATEPTGEVVTNRKI